MYYFSIQIKEVRDIFVFYFCNYISPIGSKEYLESEKIFQKNNISVKYLDIVKDVEYPQLNNGEFIDNLSIIDVIANIGVDGTLEYINEKYKLI